MCHVQKEEKWLFLKDALWGAGGVPAGAGLVDGGGRPRALIPGERVREGLAWRGKAGGHTGAGLVDVGVREAGQGGGCKGFGSGGVSGRGTGPRDGANFATYVVFLLLQKEEKWLFLKDALSGGGAGAGLVDGGVDQGP